MLATLKATTVPILSVRILALTLNESEEEVREILVELFNRGVLDGHTVGTHSILDAFDIDHEKDVFYLAE